MKKAILILLLSVGAIQCSNAQKNVIGLHLQPLAFGEIRGSFEHAFTDKFSVLLNYGYKKLGDIPSFILDQAQPTDYGLPIEFVNEISGSQFVPEFRIYFKGDDAPHGLYIAPYLRFSKYSIKYNTTANYTFSDDEFDDLPQEVIDYLDENNLGQTIGVNTIVTGDFKQKGLGVQLGYQWVVAEKLAIDLYFLGLEIDQVNFTAEAYSPDANELGIDYTRWENEIEGSIDFTNDIPLINVDVTTEVQSDKVIGIAKTLAPWYRGGIKIGFAF